jgi:hypothetical protein
LAARLIGAQASWSSKFRPIWRRAFNGDCPASSRCSPARERIADRRVARMDGRASLLGSCGQIDAVPIKRLRYLIALAADRDTDLTRAGDRT